jgi:AcrR family transcriptional regulator
MTEESLTTTEAYALYKSFSIFGKDYKLPLNNNCSHTKQEIILVSTILFSQKGYHHVSIRDIAQVIGVKTSSIYNHFKSKEEIWEKVVLHSMKLFLLYMRAVDKELINRDKIKDMLETVLFEPKKMDNVFTCHAFGVIQRNRIYNKFAGKIFRLMRKRSVNTLTRHFERCTDINPEININLVATMILVLVFFAINSKSEDLQNNTNVYDFAEFFGGIEKILVEGLSLQRPDSSENARIQ